MSGQETLFEEVTGLQVDPGHRARRTYRQTESRRRRDEGINRVQANEPSEFADVCRAAIDYLTERGGTFTSNDVRDLVALEPHHPNCWGAQINAAVRRGDIVKVGYVESDRPKAHARAIAVYRGTDPEEGAAADG